MLALTDNLVDLAEGWLGSLFDMVEYGDPMSTLLMIGVLLVVGRIISGRSPEASRFSKQVAGLTFVLYLVFRVSSGEADLADDPLGLAWGGALAAGLLGSITLVAYPGLRFLWQGLLMPVKRQVARLFHGLFAAPKKMGTSLMKPIRRRQERALEKKLRPEREAAEQAQLDATQRAQQFESYRDTLRYDLRLKFRSLQEANSMFDEDQFESMLEATLSPASQDEINRRTEMLNEQLNSCAPHELPQDITGIAAHFHKLRIDLEEAPYPDAQKRKLTRWYTMQETIAVNRFIKGQR